MNKREAGRAKRHGRIRKKMFGTIERPRLAVRRSFKNVYAQGIDDMNSKTLVSFSTRDKQVSGQLPPKGKVSKAEKLGEFYAKVLKEKGITKIAFDRGGYLYHGRVKALADGLRKGGIQF